tara:strand:+ start:679 stop:1440 length:762 start_codon:yes stop_codon:yes gene_type:complete
MKNLKKLSIFNLIKKYPKKRPALSKEVKKIFDIEYKKNRENLLSQLSESWLHFAIKGRNLLFNTTLEIGAGSLNHLKYENFSKKHIYDVIEPKKFLYENNKNKFLVNKFYKSLNNTKKNSYSRIISCAVLEHLEDLPYYLYLSSQKMKKNGYQSHSIPCEGYPIWNITWFLISGITFKLRTGKSFKEIQRHEHLNSFDEILKLVKFFYRDVQIKYSYPFFFSPYVSFYSNLTFKNPIRKNINAYLKITRNNKS